MSLNNNNAQYVGDGIYIQIDDQDPTHLVLTTGTHIIEEAATVVFIEPSEIRFLMAYMKDFLLTMEGN